MYTASRRIGPVALILVLGALVAPAAEPPAPGPASPTTPPVAAPTPQVAAPTPAESSFSIGVGFGAQLRSADLQDSIDAAALQKGILAGLGGQAPAALDNERAMALVRQARDASAVTYKAAAASFLARNAQQPGVVTTASGLQYRVVAPGDKAAASPGPNDRVSVHYRGKLQDGTEFDNSYQRGQPATFAVDGVIKGWTEALQLMKPGARWELFVPADLAYGDNPAPRSPFKPGMMLTFDVELLKVMAATPAAAPAAAAGSKSGH